ncbi:MAG TPA: hypothetical protein VGC45_15805 [Gryllotalpicola sp.]
MMLLKDRSGTTRSFPIGVSFLWIGLALSGDCAMISPVDMKRVWIGGGVILAVAAVVTGFAVAAAAQDGAESRPDQPLISATSTPAQTGEPIVIEESPTMAATEPLVPSSAPDPSSSAPAGGSPSASTSQQPAAPQNAAPAPADPGPVQAQPAPVATPNHPTSQSSSATGGESASAPVDTDDPSYFGDGRYGRDSSGAALPPPPSYTLDMPTTTAPTAPATPAP